MRCMVWFYFLAWLQLKCCLCPLIFSLVFHALHPACVSLFLRNVEKVDLKAKPLCWLLWTIYETWLDKTLHHWNMSILICTFPTLDPKIPFDENQAGDFLVLRKEGGGGNRSKGWIHQFYKLPHLNCQNYRQPVLSLTNFVAYGNNNQHNFVVLTCHAYLMILQKIWCLGYPYCTCVFSKTSVNILKKFCLLGFAANCLVELVKRFVFFVSLGGRAFS